MNSDVGGEQWGLFCGRESIREHGEASYLKMITRIRVTVLWGCRNSRPMTGRLRAMVSWLLLKDRGSAPGRLDQECVLGEKKDQPLRMRKDQGR